jgi:hypothetical protein
MTVATDNAHYRSVRAIAYAAMHPGVEGRLKHSKVPRFIAEGPGTSSKSTHS